MNCLARALSCLGASRALAAHEGSRCDWGWGPPGDTAVSGVQLTLGHERPRSPAPSSPGPSLAPGPPGLAPRALVLCWPGPAQPAWEGTQFSKPRRTAPGPAHVTPVLPSR